MSGSTRKPTKKAKEKKPAIKFHEHPLTIAAAAVVSTLTLAITVILPMWTKELENTVSSQSQSIAALTNQVNGLTASNQDLENKNLKLGEEVKSDRNKDMFDVNDIYPLGFRSVKIGESISVVKSVYPNFPAQNENKLWISVPLENSIFNQVTFYKIACNPPKDIRIDHIFFILQDSHDAGVLKDRVIGTYGDKFLHAEVDQETSEHYLETSNVHGAKARLFTDGLVLIPTDSDTVCKN